MSTKEPKPFFMTKKASVKEILKVLLLPMNPKGRGIRMYIAYPVLVLYKIMILLAVPACLIGGFVEPGVFVGFIICFLWAMPAIFGIMAFSGKVTKTQVPISEINNKIIQYMKNNGATNIERIDDGIIEFSFECNDDPIALATEISTIDGIDGVYVRVFLSNYTEGVKESKYVKNEDPLTMAYKLFIGLFATHGSIKANKLIKNLTNELSSLSL
ncbi:MAG: hypothetical protein LBN05_03455 [Oscillospiraceae bacterium]|jgi:hypothetical protein|nr:hypothetical protein [Oscillospiraceae bacterium]